MGDLSVRSGPDLPSHFRVSVSLDICHAFLLELRKSQSNAFTSPGAPTPPSSKGLTWFFASGDVGLIQVSAIIGIVLALFLGGYLSDIITAKRIAKSKGMISPEHRLLSMIPFSWVGPLGYILFPVGLSQGLQWGVFTVGFGMGDLSSAINMKI
jgi:hypothetical protein